MPNLTVVKYVPLYLRGTEIPKVDAALNGMTVLVPLRVHGTTRPSMMEVLPHTRTGGMDTRGGV